ncbi:MAG TPA: tetratricopeptide repeat protein [Paludibacteraceae bacterium]|nr:tetratricopeptide repeat protein [Paludibacteraceae bacterium]HQB68737.1 tetratricopeptide repeat protein [Paludibacteraceae bacterium]HRS67288.1 tetratricopeptide repeat protein [Paludibacteraceae bacterium]
MSKKKKQQGEFEMPNVQEALSKSEAFIETYRKELLYGIGAVVILVVAILAFHTYYLVPRETEAQEKMIFCVSQFERDSFHIALRGDGMNEGFEAIIDDYKFTDAAELAAAYAGVCAYHLGEYEEAIDYLDKFDARSVNMTPATICLRGDAYVELGEYNKAVKDFLRAAETRNEMVAPRSLKKAGLAYEALGKYDKAVKVYTEIKDTYFNSMEAGDIDKYIERAKALDK